MKRILTGLVAAGLVIGGGWYLYRLLPLLTADNEGAPKVVLLHGLGRSASSMLLLESALTGAGFDVYNIDYESTRFDIPQLVGSVGAQIAACCLESEQPVHFVGHSLGGLIARAYLAEHRPHNLARVVLPGTPNKGSELADPTVITQLPDALVEFAGPAARALTTGVEGFPASLPLPDYAVGVIAGTRSVAMADEYLPLPNDGLVSVESAKIEGMSDYVSFDVSHWELRTDARVARQVVAYLKRGTFER